MKKRTMLTAAVLAGCMVLGYPLDTQAAESDRDAVAAEPETEFIYWQSENDEEIYLLTEEGELWKIDPEFGFIADNVKEVQRGFFLTKDGSVYSIDDVDTLILENVADISPWLPGCRALTTDGEAWNLPIFGNELQVYETDVAMIIDETSAYVNTSNELVGYMDGIQALDGYNALGYYRAGVGFCIWSSPWSAADNQQPIVSSEILTAYERGFRYSGEDTSFDYNLGITENGEVWAYRVDHWDTYASDYLGANGALLSTGSEQWDWMDSDGNYYKWDQRVEYSEENPLVFSICMVTGGTDEHALVIKGDGEDYYYYKNDTEIMSGVLVMQTVNNRIYAYCSDKTVWDVTDEPVQLGILDSDDQIVLGDVDGDGKTGIEDLRMVLRYVCGKKDLTEQQIKAADVESDNELNLDDLRKLLRFVCGKIDEL